MYGRTSGFQPGRHVASVHAVGFSDRPGAGANEASDILVVTSQPLFRAALSWTFQHTGFNCELVEAACLSDAVEALRRGAFALVLLDEDPCECSALEAVKILKSQFAVPVALLSAGCDRAGVIGAIDLGACGHIQKSLSLEAMAAAISRLVEEQRPPCAGRPVGQDLLESEPPLTRAQIKVLILMEKGRLNKQIAYELGIAESTVKAHVSAIFRKLKVQNRVQAALVAHQQPVDAFGPGSSLVA